MADKQDDSLYPIAVLIDELKNEDIQVSDSVETKRKFTEFFPHSAPFELHQEAFNNCTRSWRGAHENRIGAILNRDYLR